jgi:hypothetical protein
VRALARGRIDPSTIGVRRLRFRDVDFAIDTGIPVEVPAAVFFLVVRIRPVRARGARAIRVGFGSPRVCEPRRAEHAAAGDLRVAGDPFGSLCLRRALR